MAQRSADFLSPCHWFFLRLCVIILVLSSHRITCDCVVLAISLYHEIVHAITINLLWMVGEGGIHLDFGTFDCFSQVSKL